MTLKPAVTIATFTLLSAMGQAGDTLLDDIARQMGGTLKELAALDESDKKVALSNQAQIASTDMANREEAKINAEIGPLQMDANAADQLRQQIISMGCPENGGTVDIDLANACNPLIVRHRTMHNSVMSRFELLKSRQSTVAQIRAGVTQTTLANASTTKANNARRAELDALKADLQTQALAEVIRTKRAQAVKACGTDSCCLRVVYDGANPRLCGIGLICRRMEGTGIFGSGRRICEPAAAPPR